MTPVSLAEGPGAGASYLLPPAAEVGSPGPAPRAAPEGEDGCPSAAPGSPGAGQGREKGMGRDTG